MDRSTATESGLRQVCSDLQELKQQSADELRRNAFATYTAFVSTSDEISHIEAEVGLMRDLLPAQAALIHNCVADVESVHAEFDGRDLGSHHETAPSAFERKAQRLPDVLDVLLAERNVPQALALLEDAERLIEEAQRDEFKQPSNSIRTLQAALSERRARLAEQLVQTARQPAIRGSELLYAIAALDKLGDGPRAHTLLLKSHHQRLQNSLRALRPSAGGCGAPGAYTLALSQLVFSAIAQAVRDSGFVFGEGSPYSSELVVWARSETQNLASLMVRHVLSPSRGARSAAECVRIALGHFSLLERQRLALSSVLTKLLVRHSARI